MRTRTRTEVAGPPRTRMAGACGWDARPLSQGRLRWDRRARPIAVTRLRYVPVVYLWETGMGRRQAMAWWQEACVIVGALCLTLTLAVVLERHGRRVKLRRFRGRERLDCESFYDRFYAGSAFDRSSVNEAMEAASAALGIPACLMRPWDRFDAELADPGLTAFHDDVAFLSWHLQRFARKHHATLGDESLHTLDDYLRAYCRIASMAETKARTRHPGGQVT